MIKVIFKIMGWCILAPVAIAVGMLQCTKIIQMSRPDLVGFLLVFHLILLSFPLDSSS